ncbi:MAG: VWA domain-containing protein [Thermoanaerobaculia bacterium]|nr:VWA domain-containing protein [Thermoanaerobaculia bacterium]
MRRFGIVVLLLTLSASVTTAEEEVPPVFSERIEVELVNVEIWATDKAGRPVVGLGPEDLVVRHDGEPVEIEFFTEFRDGRPRTEGEGDLPSEAGGPPPNHLVVYFDELNLHPKNRSRVIEALRELLDDGAVEPSRTLILRQTRGLFVVAPFGSGEREIDSALERLAEESVRSAGSASPFDRAVREIEELWARSQDTAGSGTTGLAGVPGAATLEALAEGGGGGPSGTVGGSGQGSGGGGLGGDACDIMVSRAEPLIQSLTRERGGQVGATLERLSEAITFLAGLDGVKTLLYVGDRLESSPGAEVARLVQRYCPTSQPGYLMDALAADMSADFLAVSGHANANRVTFYALQAEGLRAGGSSSASRQGSRRGGGASSEALRQASERGGLLTLSAETGGRVLSGRNEIEESLHEIVDEMGTYYSLAYLAPATQDSPRHEIEVESVAPGIEVRHRRSYLDKSADERVREKLLGALNLGLVSNPLGIRLGAEAIREPVAGRFVLPLRVLVPAESVMALPGGADVTGSLAVKVIAHDAAAGTLHTVDRQFRVRLPEQTADQWVPLGVDLERPAGVHTIAVGVVDEVSGRVSYVSTTLQIGPESE